MVDHHRLIIVGLVAVLRRVRRDKLAIRQRHGVLSLHHHALGRARLQIRALDGNVRRGIDDGRTRALGGEIPAGHVHVAAAAIRADGRGRVALGFGCHVGGVHRRPAGGHKAARAVARRADNGMRDVHRRARTIGEHAVRMRTIASYDEVRQIERRAVGGEHAGVFAVEIGFVAAGVAGLFHGSGGILGRRCVGYNGMAAVGRVAKRFACGNVGIRKLLRRKVERRRLGERRACRIARLLGRRRGGSQRLVRSAFFLSRTTRKGKRQRRSSREPCDPKVTFLHDNRLHLGRFP